MRKTHRFSIRTSKDVHQRLQERAYTNGRDSMSQEVHMILEKALGIKRGKKPAIPTT